MAIFNSYVKFPEGTFGLKCENRDSMIEPSRTMGVSVDFSDTS